MKKLLTIMVSLVLMMGVFTYTAQAAEPRVMITYESKTGTYLTHAGTGCKVACKIDYELINDSMIQNANPSMVTVITAVGASYTKLDIGITSSSSTSVSAFVQARLTMGGVTLGTYRPIVTATAQS